MDFHLTKEQLLVRKMYREFAENEVKPLATEIDEEERFPMETVEKMAKLGMMGIYFPKQYGGAGADVLSYAMCVEELAKVCGTTAVIVSAHTSLCAAPIFENGTEEQKMKYLPDLCSGKKIGAFGLTEPGAGTDAQGQQTTAVLDESGENYILNGSKCFITNGNVADTFVIIAVTGKTTDKRGRTMKEISAFIVEKNDKGFSQGKHEKKMGIRGSSTCDLIFEDCVIPKDRMLGKKGEGFKIAMKTLDGGRIGIASQALGIGEGAVEEAIKYTKERVQFGKPLATEIDEEERFPMETVEKMAKLGMMGIYFPKQYGGAGADVLSYAMCVEELAKVCGTTAVIVSAHTSLCAAPIFENGTEEQKMKYLPDLCSGKKIGAFGLTEPGAGTDAQGQQTTAVLDESGENYILNGSKCFITNGNVADTFVIIAVTGKTTDKRGRTMKEISAFIVEKNDKGFSQGKHEKKMGIRGSSTCDLIFEDCVIPKDRMLGKKGEGFKIAMKTLDGGRIGIASQALGIGEGAVEEAIKYTKERVQFGKRISQFQNTQFQLADMHTRMQAAQYVVYAAAMKKQNHEPYSMDAAMAKLFAAEAASDVTRRAVQLFGGYGYTREYPVERMMRDAKITEIYEGTSEVQRMVIASNLGVK